MMNSEIIILAVQVIAALGVVVSVIYLGVQIRQQNKIAKAEFGHHLTQRLYDRSFQTSKDREFSEFLSSLGGGMSQDLLYSLNLFSPNFFLVSSLFNPVKAP